MKIKILTLATGFCLSMGGWAIGTAEEAAPTPDHKVSGSLGLTTNYLFRGISQTGNGPAIQGGLRYDYTPLGLYGGVWASNIKSEGFAGSSMETDFSLGWAPTFDKLGLDIGYLRYQYFRTHYDDNNTDEFHIGANYDLGVVVPSFTVNYSNDWYGTGKSWYYDLSAKVPLPAEVSLAVHYGWSDFDTVYDDYSDWRIGVSKEFFGLGFDLSYIGTSGLDENRNCDNVTFKCDDQVVFTISKAF